MAYFVVFFATFFFVVNLHIRFIYGQQGVGKNPGESTNYKEAVFLYPSGILSERDIPVCANENNLELIACNIVNKRYYYPPTIDRLCRCPDRNECPWEFSDFKVVNKKEGILRRISDSNTAMLSSRAQMKFCNEVTALPKCTKNANETALKIVTIDKQPETKRIYKICHCPAFKRWTSIGDELKEFNNGTLQRTLYYSCDKLPRCNTGDLCGHVRTDNYSTFFLCSCPIRHSCYPPDMNDVYNATELLYSGPVIKSRCMKV